jgi:hypothetical protein
MVLAAGAVAWDLLVFAKQIGIGCIGLSASWRQPWWWALLNVIEHPADELWIGDVRDTRNCPPQNGQSVITISNTRFKRCAQVNSAVSGSVRSMGGCVELRCWYAGAVSGSLGICRFRTVAGVSTIVRRMGELGAKTPW